ncbi:MAG: hypothetical protein Q8Q42_04515 [Nanoarchaeota archaeon]|nr:hypothetical protein [Nanoarchaeota archaeon]
MKSFGIFDVVLPFLLVFTVVFGVLEKTKIFGTEGDKKTTRKNLNAMVAFVVGFFVVVATQIVYLIQTALPIIMLILVLVIAFMIVYGSTLSEGEIDIWSHFGKGRGYFAFGIIIAIIAIVLGAMGMLGSFIEWLYANISGTILSSAILLVIIGIFMAIVLKGKNTEDSS